MLEEAPPGLTSKERVPSREDEPLGLRHVAVEQLALPIGELIGRATVSGTTNRVKAGFHMNLNECGKFLTMVKKQRTIKKKLGVIFK